MNDRRERLYDDLVDVTGPGTKSGAIDAAARFYCEMAGGNMVRGGQGAIPELLELANEQGSVTIEEIADILGTDEYPIDVSVRIEHGPPDS